MARGPVFFHHQIVLSMYVSLPTKLKNKNKMIFTKTYKSKIFETWWGSDTLSNRFEPIHNFLSRVNSAKTKEDIQRIIL